jgi:predicted O-methyltransferase YrrM
MFQKIDWESCLKINDQEENKFLEKVARQHSLNLGSRILRSLEIGSYQGLSAAILAQFGIVFCIDLWADIFDGVAHYDQIGKVNYEEFRSNMVRLKLMNESVFPSISSSKMLEHMMPMDFDIIYIDANHDYEPIRQDILATERHLRKGGLWIFHDYKREGDRPELGVNRAVDELLDIGKFSCYQKYKGCIVLKETP